MENITSQPVTNTIHQDGTITVNGIQTTPRLQVNEPEPTPNLPHQDLLKALYFVLDTFDNCGVKFFLDGETCEKAMKGHELTGDRVHIGLRRMIYESGAGRILDTAFPTKKEGNILKHTYMGIPIEVRLYEDNPYILSPDSINYRYENFHTPNPYSKFKEMKDNG